MNGDGKIFINFSLYELIVCYQLVLVFLGIYVIDIAGCWQTIGLHSLLAPF